MIPLIDRFNGATRCRRPCCGGSLIDFGDGARCLLCGRGPAESGSVRPDEYRAALAALMAAPAGSVVTRRSYISGETYEREGWGRPPKWLPWSGYGEGRRIHR